MSLCVCQLLPALEVGGVERGTVEVARALVEAGHESTVIAAPGGRMIPRLKEAGTTFIPMDVGAKRLRSLALIPKLGRLFAEKRYDIIHVRSRMPAWLAWYAWKRMDPMTRPRLVTTVHGPYSVNRYSRIMTRGERVIAISEFIRDYVMENYADVPGDRITVIPRGVSPEDYPFGYRPSAAWQADWMAQHPETLERCMVTLPARVTRWKGQAEFIRVVEKLLARGVPVHGVIAGGAEKRRARFMQELREHVAERGLANSVTFLGDRQDLREVMAHSNIVVSITNEPEAFGRTTLEALRMGVPVVGYNHGGTKEILETFFPMGLCPVGDLDAVAERIDEIYRHGNPVPDIPAMTKEEMLQATLKLYTDLAASPRP